MVNRARSRARKVVSRKPSSEKLAGVSVSVVIVCKTQAPCGPQLTARKGRHDRSSEVRTRLATVGLVAPRGQARAQTGRGRKRASAFRPTGRLARGNSASSRWGAKLQKLSTASL